MWVFINHFCMQLSDRFVSSELFLLAAQCVWTLAKPQIAVEAAFDINNNTTLNWRRKWEKLSGAEERKARKRRSVPVSRGNFPPFHFNGLSRSPGVEPLVSFSPSALSPRRTLDASLQRVCTFVDRSPGRSHRHNGWTWFLNDAALYQHPHYFWARRLLPFRRVCVAKQQSN